MSQKRSSGPGWVERAAGMPRLTGVAKHRWSRGLLAKAIQSLGLSVLAGLLVAVLAQVAFADEESVPRGRPSGLALLVGCTGYDHLPSESALRGPNNDITLVWSVLTDRFGWAESNIRVLADGHEQAAGRPTYANIVAQLKRLTETETTADCVLVYFAGHGLQVAAAGEDELDALDEAFLAADFEPPGEEHPEPRNLLSDNELFSLIEAIAKRHRSVWLVVDSCHSGTLARSADADERAREVVLPKAASGRPVKRPATKPSGSRKLPGNVTCLYACEASEPTFEARYPRGVRGAQCHGLLSYTLASVLLSEPGELSYDELHSRICDQYTAWGRSRPTPVLEGLGIAAPVLGHRLTPIGPTMTLSSENGSLVADVGLLDGVASGATLEVTCPDGRVEVARIERSESRRSSIQWPGDSAPPFGKRLKWVQRTRGFDTRFPRLFVDGPGDAGGIGPEVVARIEALQPRFCELVQARDEADFIVTIGKSAAQVISSNDVLSEDFQALAVNSDVAEELCRSAASLANRVCRAELLRRVAYESARRLPESEGPLTSTFESGSSEGGKVDRIRPGTECTLQLKLSGERSRDVCVLYIDSGSHIDCLFPVAGEDNRMFPGDRKTLKLQVDDRTRGRERMIVLAFDPGTRSRRVRLPLGATDEVEGNRTPLERGADRDHSLKPFSSLFDFGLSRGGERGESDAAGSELPVAAFVYELIIEDGP